ncbi:hypothetical protein Fot_43890 [Forsythia ovata]|uniref:Uncharacterized protein n=1 Tax=Forsythia ovata TaxID=205694 RepID=A0ABD1R2V8_9LAMI
MSLLEVISKASSTASIHPHPDSNYPIVLNPDPILLKLKPETDELNDESPVKRVTGWEISQTDAGLIEAGQKFFKKLKRKLKNTNTFSKDEFLGMFTSYLEKIGEKIGISIGVDKSDEEYVRKLVERLGFSMGRDVKSLILEACVALEYFLLPPRDGYKSLVSVREEWENQALLAIEKVSDRGLGGKQKSLARDASKLNGEEMMALIKYLGKWLRKYERFPQVVPCPKASSLLGLKACDWVPTLENVVKCLGLVVDEHFSSLVLHSEFHEQLRSLEKVVSSLVAEARLCGTLTNLTERLKGELQGM